jgi:hypothetical protein
MRDGQKHRGSAARPTFSATIATVIQLMASSSQILLISCYIAFVQVSLQKWLWLYDKGNRARSKSSINCITFGQDWAAVMKFKTMKINSKGFL